MEQNLSLYEDKLQFYLVQAEPDESQLSSHMQFAREKLEENVKETNIKAVTPAECLDLSSNFTKKHIVVFDSFEGDCFESMKNTQALILGPRCVISCLMDNVTLPDIDSPMFNLAMRDLIVCLSSFDIQEKIRLKRLIGYMGGRCIHRLAKAVTHLVTDSIRSKKYERAMNYPHMKIMKAAWVNEVWKESSKDNILATNRKFEIYNVPIFYKLKVTTTGLTRKEKGKVEEIITREGGHYFGEFSSGNIDVVIAKRNASETAKLKAAINARKDCLCVEWILDSIKKGSALSIEEYRIDLQAKKHTSTPEKQPSGVCFNNTQATGIDISNINFAGTINDSAMSNLSISTDSSMVCRKRKSNDAANENKDLSYKTAYENLNLQNAKRAGSFLDGCNVFMCGFTKEECDKINKILNFGGATRFDTINSNVSHILIGSPSKKDISMLLAVRYDAVTVKLEWLVESINQKTAVDCEPFKYKLNNGKTNFDDEQAKAPSPASKRNILLMSGQTSQEHHMKSQDILARAEDDIIGQYLKAPSAKEQIASQQSPEPVAGTSKMANDVFKKPAEPQQQLQSNTNSECTDFDSESKFSVSINNQVMFLENLKIFIHGFDTESHESLVEDCRIAGADIVEDENYKGMVDFLILPVNAISMDGIIVKAKNIVNHNWLINAKRLHQVSDSMNAVTDPLQNVPYFYKPIFFQEELVPLAHMVIVFSLYSSDERTFLFQLAQILGAEVMESFVRANKPLLICPEGRSSKYEAAIRWRLPVVNKSWLLDCYEAKRRLPLRNYLVGDAIAPIDDVDEDDEILSSQSVVMPESGIDTPPSIPNRRVEQLRGAPNSKQSTPSSPLIPTFNREVLNELDTPTRDSILQRWKELEEETPQTKQRRYEKLGIKSPEEATTPYWMEYKRAQLEERRTRHAPTQEQIEKIKNRTPWSEVKRSLWKAALGDEYESPSQCYSMNMQQDTSHINYSRPTGRVLTYESSGDTEADKNIQALADFIKQSKQMKDELVQYVDLPNTAPPESEMIATEQHEVIGWRDPSEVVEDTPKRNTRPKILCFIISCASDDLRNKIVKQILTLGGKICENLAKYDSTCTHFVCEKPSRSEKMLSCVAAGKWVLSIIYIQKSYDAKRFLNEEEYEWGNPKATELPQIDGNDLNIARAAHRWRKKIQLIVMPSSKGIFKEFCVILKTAKNESLRTLIEAGRGQVIEINSNLTLDKQMDVLTNVTHVVCQSGHANFTANEIKALDQANVKCINMNYLQHFIINEKKPDVNDYLIKSKV